jgi:hypothetical protein
VVWGQTVASDVTSAVVTWPGRQAVLPAAHEVMV